ncbi:glutathione S-transferase Mu 5-like [Artemia franciscana]|uniref:Glutathione S-transferase n=1 Tax=Artemia franciscana TaxID=6661 RepID=A0AA88I937_ARTSF|nr:hypothetical protein QYM36_002997 [Artemia franciscana]
MNKPTLAYWDIRGLAQPIRLLLAYTGTDFEDKYYVCGEGPSYDKSCWFDTKHSLGLDFPNLPYYIDGDVKITQSNAILRFIARKYDPSLLGSNSEEMVRVDMLENEAGDFRNGFVRLCYRNFNENKDNYKNALPLKLKEFSNFLGNRKFFAGDHVTFPDFIMYEMLDQHKIFSPSCLEEFPNLKDFVNRFESIDNIKKYMNSDKFIRMPLNNRMAEFGAQKA